MAEISEKIDLSQRIDLNQRVDLNEKIGLETSWKRQLIAEFSKPYMQELKKFLQQEKAKNKTIYPLNKHIFHAFSATPFDKVRVVILGQDPYHGPKQAHGLCFSVLPGIKPPPSLLNIYKELASDGDVNFTPVTHGYLEPWTQQGVLLLNSVLTVERGKPGSHQGKGWEIFTDQVINLLNQQTRPIIFVLWGNYAKKKGKAIDASRHVVLTSTHPSPFSANNGFLGCRHFSTINKCLAKWQQKPIDWQLPA